MKNLLIAAKHLNHIFETDDFFNQSTILMLNELNGSTHGGIILNIKESPYLTDAMPSIIQSFEAMHLPNIEMILPNIRLGGPTSGPAVCIHKIADLGKGREVSSGVYWSYKTEHIRQIVLMPNSEYRLYMGVTSWEDKEQLNKELKLGAWQQCKVTEKIIFENGNREELWLQTRKESDFQFWKKTGIKKSQNYLLN